MRLVFALTSYQSSEEVVRREDSDQGESRRTGPGVGGESPVPHKEDYKQRNSFVESFRPYVEITDINVKGRRVIVFDDTCTFFKSVFGVQTGVRRPIRPLD